MEKSAVGQDRIRRLQAALKERDIAAMVCMKPENSFYLSGFNPIIYSHPVLAILPAEGPPAVLVHALRDDHAKSSAWVKDIRLYGAWSTKKTMGANWLAALREILDERGCAKGPLGIEEDYLPLTRVRQFEETFPGAELKNVSDIVATARLIKEPHEIALARQASRLCDAGMETAVAAVAAGANERQASLAAMSAMNRLWAKEMPDTEVADFGSLEGGFHNGLACWTLYGDRVAINADNPTTREPRPGEVGLIMIWAVADGIHAENERSVAIGPIDDDKRRAYEAMLEIRGRTKHLMRAGTPVAEFYGAAKAEYVRLGFGDYLPGRIGHGLGLGAHEAPSLEGNAKRNLEANMLITFEPNLRIPEWGGLQHSDTVLITDGEPDFLTRTDNGFLQV